MPRLLRMDGLRGLLAVYVMLGHALPFTTLPGWATAPFGHGEAAVDLFFALSGLVVSQSLTHHRGFRAFIAARARRLLPVYVLVLAASILLLLAGDPLPFMPWTTPLAREFWAAGLPPQPLAHILAHLTLTHGLIPQGALPYAYITLLGPAWSLSTEWQFYLLLPAVGRGHERRAILVLFGLALLWALAPAGGAWAMNRAFLPSAAGYFALGLATARRLKGAPPAEFAAVLALACLFAGGPDKALIPLAWALIVLAQRHPWGAPLQSRPLLCLGAISYPLYLVNEPVQRALALIIAPHAGGHFTLLWLPPALAGPVLCAWALHVLVERPFARFGSPAHAAPPLPSPPIRPI
jgi:peptidoglycan/LPS O-acetylase OafA/YrhL